MQYSPRSLTIHEDNPVSVASYDVEVRDTGVMIAHKEGCPADPSGDTTVPLNDLFTPDMLGKDVGFYVRQTGSTGAQSDWQQAGAGMHFIITMLPDGAESITINL